MSVAPCRGCGLEIEWIQDDQGQNIPLDLSAAVYLRETRAGGAPVARRSAIAFVNHFNTCPAASLFSRSRKRTPPPAPVGRPRIVCLCGSGRFREAFEKAEFEETLAGAIVLTIGCNAHDVERSEELKPHKPALDQLHLRKIEMADGILVVNVGGYVGRSTRREIEHALKLGKGIRWLEPVEITPPAEAT